MPYDAADDARLSDEFRVARVADPSDPRSPFAHDRDRILYCTAFRRLAGKTQVVAVGELGLFHTRLTHTLKVAQLGRRLAERLQREYVARNGGQVAEDTPPNPDLVEAACLAHDLGHPPFGHVGEVMLSKAFDDAVIAGHPRWKDTKCKELGGFEGNAQTFRLLTYLVARAAPKEAPRLGLDLTRATLDAATKYPRLRVHRGRVMDKWGAIGLDRDRLAWVREGHPSGPDAKPCFEAQVMDWADDVTYAVHDMIDFYRARFIPLDRLFALKRRRRREDGTEPPAAIPEEAERFLKKAVSAEGSEWSLDQAEDAWRNLWARVVEIFKPFSATFDGKAATDVVSSRLIGYLVEGVTYSGAAPCRFQGDFLIHQDKSEADMRRLICFLMKQLLWQFVIHTNALATQQRGHEHIVRSLLQICSESEDVLPLDRQEEFAQHGDLLRAATDHVASLTEQQAQALYQRLLGLAPGEITDLI